MSTPSSGNEKPSWFDRRATSISTNVVAKAWFFVFCVTTIVVWLPSYFLIGTLDTWQLIINTFTTCVTYLLVALLQNTQSRDSRAMHKKLNAIAEGLADVMEALSEMDNTMEADVRELREAVGLEDREGS